MSLLKWINGYPSLLSTSTIQETFWQNNSDFGHHLISTRNILNTNIPKGGVPMNDRDVLNSILNPNLPLGEGMFDPDQQAPETDTEASSCDQNIKQLEKEAVKIAEEGDLIKALEVFNEIVELAPLRASSYNNRAQALRLAGRPAEALQDLDRAIELSKGEGRAGSSALCQRGVLYRKEGRDDDALTDFKAAASEGSGFAKTMLVEMNPYAAMCNAMLRNVFTAMANGEDSEQLMSNNLKTKSG